MSRPTLHTSQQAFLAAFLGSAVGGGFVLARNELGFQRRGRAAGMVSLGLVLTFLLIALGVYLDFSTIGIAAGFSVGAWKVADLQWGEVQEQAEEGGWGFPVLAGVGGAVVTLGIGLGLSFFGPDPLLRQVTLEGGDIVEYRGGATPEQARQVGELFLELGAFLGKGDGTVRLVQEEEGQYGLGFYLSPSEADENMHLAVFLLSDEVSKRVLSGAEVRPLSCDSVTGDCREWKQ